MKPESSRSVPSRFVFIDGLRGLAALSIVLFHLWWYEPTPTSAFSMVVHLPVIQQLLRWYEPDPAAAISLTNRGIEEVMLKIRGGVQVLLVISGFVIAYTLRNTWMNPREVLLFLGRRLVRLVPAYWTTLGVVILVDMVSQQIGELPSPFEGGISLARISAHLTFLQDIFGHESFSAGIWTLCIEMQFYLVAVLGWLIAQRAFRRPQVNEPRPSARAIYSVFAPFAFISLFYWRGMDSTESLVIHFLWMFFLGMATWWTLDGTISLVAFGLIAGIATMELVLFEKNQFENLVALSTALAILVAGRQQKLDQWLNWPWLQYLGRISYSLYLIHFPVCHLLVSAGWKFFSHSPTLTQAMFILIGSLVASLLAAHAMYQLVEFPSARWAARMKNTNAALPVGKPTLIA